MAEKSKAPKKMGTAKRVLLTATGLVSLIVLGVVFLGPALLASALPWLLNRTGVAGIDRGQFELERARLSWFGGFELTGLSLVDNDGTVVFDLSFTGDRGILDLASNAQDLGTLEAEGEVHIVREEDGRFNFQRLLAKPPATGSGSTTQSAPVSGSGTTFELPFGGKIDLSAATVVYEDASLSTRTGGSLDSIEILAITGAATIEQNQGVTLELSGEPVFKSAAEGDRDGRFTLRIEASGTDSTAEATAVLSYDSEDAATDLSVRLAGGSLALTEPGSIELGAALTRLLLGTASDVSFDEAPSVLLAINELSLPIDEKFAPDLSLASARLDLTLGATTGTMPIAGEARAFATDAWTASFASPNLSESATLTATGSAKIAGRSAGALAADLRFGPLLTRDASQGFSADSIEGTAEASGVALALVDELLGNGSGDHFGAPLAELIGPELDASLSAENQEDAGSRFRVALSAANLDAKGEAVLLGQQLTLSDPLRIETENLAPLWAALGIRQAQNGSANITVEAGTLDLADPATSFRGKALVRVNDIDGTGPGLAGQPAAITLAQTRVIESRTTVRVTEDGATATGQSEIRVGGKRTVVDLDATLPPLAEVAAAAGLPAFDATVTMNDLPAEVAGLFEPTPAEGEEPRWIQLRKALGGEPDLVLTAASAGDAEPIAWTASIEAPLARIATSGSAGSEALRFEASQIDWTIDPAVLQDPAVVAALPPSIRLTPADAGQVSVAVDPFAISEGQPVEPLIAHVSGSFELSDLSIQTDPDQRPVSLGPARLEGLRAKVALPAFAAEGVTCELRTDLYASGPLATLEVDGAMHATGPEAEVRLVNIDTEAAGRMLVPFAGENIAVDLPEALSPRASVLATVTPTEDGLDLVASARSRRLRTDSELRARLHRDRSLELLEPARLAWRLTPGFTQRFLASADGSAVAELEQNVEVLFNLDRLTRDGDGMIDAAARMSAQALGLRLEDRSLFVINTLQADATMRDGSTRFNLESRQRGSIQPTTLKGSIVRGQLDAELNAPNLPTAIADAFASTEGLLTTMMGPSFSATATARDLGARSSRGNLSIDIGSERADLRVRGTTIDTRFGPALRLDQRTRATLSAVTPEFAARITRGLPVFPGLEKSRGQQPGTITTTGLVIPLNGRLEALNGELTIDPGTASLRRGGRLASILDLPGAGKLVGEQLEPLTLTVASGTVFVPRYTIPLGEFNVEVEGESDLVRREVDMTMWAPLGALTDELSGSLNLGIGGAFNAVPGVGDLSQVPISFSGSFDNVSIEPDAGRFLESIPQRLVPEVPGLRDFEKLFNGR